MQDTRRTLPPTMLRALAAALVLAVAAIIALANVGMGVAEDGDEQEESSEALQPTEIVADIPEGYGELFPLDWGGGSLYHLKGRLATMGCMANTLWLHDGGEWRGYNQYQVPSTLTQEFRDQYAEFVPPGRLYATCFNICEFKIPGQSETCPSTIENFLENTRYSSRFHPLDKGVLCTRDFDPIVAARVLPVLPILPNTCIVRQEAPFVAGEAERLFRGLHSQWIEPSIIPSIITIYAPSDYVAAQRPFRIRLYAEMHEMCHINQNWHVASGLQTGDPQPPQVEGDNIWIESPAAQELILLVGFYRHDDDGWALPTGSIYTQVYSANPVELAAELCQMYLFAQIGLDSGYRHRSYDNRRGRFDWRSEPIEFDVDMYLTPEIRRWLETWMLLPDLAGQSDD